MILKCSIFNLNTCVVIGFKPITKITGCILSLLRGEITVIPLNRVSGRNTNHGNNFYTRGGHFRNRRGENITEIMTSKFNGIQLEKTQAFHPIRGKIFQIIFLDTGGSMWGSGGPNAPSENLEKNN